ncbi:hypothetical protein Glove_26g124 [Diversispora epigaea]|uniref:Uncharacterized protein n=1 Tax=Diversispora epigaea TaxID=1348612 RepID=A0A397JPZ6_9GLOM|nr:hypothetical protein Glove_26g124 [Diversispora epigaea]
MISHKYPETTTFSLKQNGTNYTYNIISEGFYPPKNIVKYTSAYSRIRKQFKIPDNYIVQTIHVPKIDFRFLRENFEQIVESKEFSTKVTTEYLQKKNPNTHTLLSGIHVFGLNAKDVKHELNRAFEKEISGFYNPIDQPILQEIYFNVQDKNYYAKYNNKNKENENERINAFTKVIDKGPISREAYRNLTTLQPELPRDRTIYKNRKKINIEMNQKIPIFIIDIKNTSFTSTNETIDIEDPEIIEEVLQSIDKAGYRKITDILIFVIPNLIIRKVLDLENSIIYIRISGDGRNVGRKVKHVIITCTILDDILNIYKADFHYTIILYPGVENYEILHNVMEQMIDELNSLVLNSLIDSNGTKWKIEPYFSSDWKFLAIILGFNAANANFFLESKEFSTKVTTEYLQKKNPNTHTLLSGIHVFGLNAKDVKHELNRAFEKEISGFYNPIDQPILQEIYFNVQDKNYYAKYNNKNKENENERINAFTKVIDKGPISREAYRNLTTLQPELPRDRTIYKNRKKINIEMNQKIPIFIIDIKNTSFTSTNETIDIEDPEIIEEVLQSIDKAGYRKITDILIFVIPNLIIRKVLDLENSIIYIRISGDGRNVGRKVKHVIITCTILDDILNIYKADFHYTIILYPGVENYEILHNVMEQMIDELNSLVLNSLIDSNGTKWKIEPYFSSDWKFLAIILGFNAANANFFCPWYDILNIYKADFHYTIILYPGVENYEILHNVMEQMIDELNSLVLNSLIDSNGTKWKIEPYFSSDWKFLAIILGFNAANANFFCPWYDKEAVLRDFDFGVIFDNDRVILINDLWREFYKLYKMMKKPETDSTFFTSQVKKWLDLFLTPFLIQFHLKKDSIDQKILLHIFMF